MMKKKKIRVSEEPPSPSSYFPVGEEAKARFRYHYLLQDYQDLLKETEEKRKRLEKALQRKIQLLAEVKFLRRKRHQFSTPTPRTDEFKSKQQKPRKSHKDRTFVAPFDLNQAFLQTEEETEQLETERNCRDGDGLSGFPRGGGDALANDDAVVSICRGSGIGSSRAGKRRVSWQDQLVLRV